MAFATDGQSASNAQKSHFQPRGAYEEAVLGFREYWYPVCCSGEITETPKAFTLLGDPVVMVRRDGEIYALKDECPHRGTQLSMINTRKNLEFPGTPTITCAYHGWTYDVRDGKCVAVISEGPDSPVPAAGIRAKTYPIEVRRGMVWIWMGSSKAVPVEDDIPNLLLDPKAVVKGFYRVKFGNWRFHAENVGAGHAGMVHKSTFRNWFGHQPMGLPSWPRPSLVLEDHNHKGVGRGPYPEGRGPGWSPGQTTLEYPGLGPWYSRPAWQRKLFSRMPGPPTVPGPLVSGINSSLLMLPGMFRVPNFPNTGYMYYEWYVPVDEENYIYMQLMAFWPKNWLDRLRYELKYYFLDRVTGPVLFNNQDAAMVAATTNYYKRTGNMRYLTKVAPHDQDGWVWRRYCDEQARGVGTAYQKRAPSASRVAESVADKRELVGDSVGD